MRIGKKAVEKRGITVKQAKVLACIENEETVSTEEIAKRLTLYYQDARNQINALSELGLMDVFDHKGKTLLYGLTPSGRSMITDVLAKATQLMIGPRAIESNGEANGYSAPDQNPGRLGSDVFVEKASEVCVLLIGLPDLASLIQQLVAQSHMQA